MYKILIASAGAVALAGIAAGPAAAAGARPTLPPGVAIVACTTGWNQHAIELSEPTIGPGDLKALAKSYYSLQKLSAKQAAAYLVANSDGTVNGIITLCHTAHEELHIG